MRRWIGNMLSLLLACSSANTAPAATAQYDYDLFVIGGGSGGLACAKEAAALGARVGLADYVRPSPKGSRWGLGGTCVNVGCIPKKLMHHAGQLRQVIEQDAPAYGYDLSALHISDVPEKPHALHVWATLVRNVQKHVKSLNFGYMSALQKVGVKYYNKHGSLCGGHTVQLRGDKGDEISVSAGKIVVAVGGRPRLPDDFLGAAEHCIVSDDLFSLKDPPGKTLVVGGGYVALECAGFLRSLGYDVSLLMRSVPLRGFDRQCSDMVLTALVDEGVIVMRGVPICAEESASGRTRVRWSLRDPGSEGEGRPGSEGEGEFDTVLVATGRAADTSSLNLDAVGLSSGDDGKIASSNEATNVPHVYVIGDAASEAPSSRPELTPVAIRAGQLLAQRLYGGGSATMDNRLIPTAVFTPLEYSCVGMSEEEALTKLGPERLEVYHTHYQPLEWTLGGRPNNLCYCKMLCDSADSERIVGLHVVGDHAAEIMQGFAVALRCGATKSDVDATIGIHPCTAEELVALRISKRSGLAAQRDGC